MNNNETKDMPPSILELILIGVGFLFYVYSVCIIPSVTSFAPFFAATLIALSYKNGIRGGAQILSAILAAVVFDLPIALVLVFAIPTVIITQLLREKARIQIMIAIASPIICVGIVLLALWADKAKIVNFDNVFNDVTESIMTNAEKMPYTEEELTTLRESTTSMIQFLKDTWVGWIMILSMLFAAMQAYLAKFILYASDWSKENLKGIFFYMVPRLVTPLCILSYLAAIMLPTTLAQNVAKSFLVVFMGILLFDGLGYFMFFMYMSKSRATRFLIALIPLALLIIMPYILVLIGALDSLLRLKKYKMKAQKKEVEEK